jgi:glycosyltransferase involved in cell wall biosynthesis
VNRRVAIFLPSFAGGGAQRVFLALADLLVERGWEVDLVVATASGELSAEVPVKARLVDLGRSRTVSALVPLTRYLRQSRPAVLLSTLDHANLVAIGASRLSRRDVKVVLRVSNLTSDVARRATGVDRAVYQVARRAYKGADVLAAPSAAAAADLDSWLGLPAGTTFRLPNPVVTDHLLAAAHPPTDDPWFAPDAPPVVLSVSRLQPHKGVRRLVEAFAVVATARPARLLILGDGPQRAELERLVSDLGLALGPDGDVWFRGFDPEPFPAMAGCRVFVLPSEMEGLPGALIQAVACGARVVSTRCPGAAEILDEGRYGQLVPVGDTAALADAIRAALDAPAGGPGPSACAAYTARAAADAYDAVLHRLAAPPSRSRRSRKVRACPGS